MTLRRAHPGLVLAVVLGALCVIAPPGHANPRQSSPKTHGIYVSGYWVDTSLVSESQVTETLPTLQHQIEIIEAANLPRQVRSFFRKVPIAMDPSLTGSNGLYAQRNGKWVVLARPGQWPADRAILLHELLHAYHREVLLQPTPQIDSAFAAARGIDVYPPQYRDAYFLSNPREYFAVIGEVFLVGPTFRPPYNCAAVQKAQPAFIAYLADLFGKHGCQ